MGPLLIKMSAPIIAAVLSHFTISKVIILSRIVDLYNNPYYKDIIIGVNNPWILYISVDKITKLGYQNATLIQPAKNIRLIYHLQGLTIYPLTKSPFRIYTVINLAGLGSQNQGWKSSFSIWLEPISEMRARICLASSAFRGVGEDRTGSGVGVSTPVSSDDVDRASSSTLSLVASAATSTVKDKKKTLVISLGWKARGVMVFGVFLFAKIWGLLVVGCRRGPMGLGYSFMLPLCL